MRAHGRTNVNVNVQVALKYAYAPPGSVNMISNYVHFFAREGVQQVLCMIEREREREREG